jgi:ammonia channel protein AmtB
VKKLQRLHAIIDPIALRILKWMNGIVGVLMIGITAFSALHPNFPAEMQAALNLTPIQGMLFGILWCSAVAWIARRAARYAP